MVHAFCFYMPVRDNTQEILAGETVGVDHATHRVSVCDRNK